MPLPKSKPNIWGAKFSTCTLLFLEDMNLTVAGAVYFPK
jgi:hypothetical protein